MTQGSERSLAPACRGEQASGGTPSERTLTSLSRSSAGDGLWDRPSRPKGNRGRPRSEVWGRAPLIPCFAALLVGAFLFVETSLWAAVRGAPIPGAGSAATVSGLLQPLGEQLRRACGCDSFRVVWGTSESLLRAASSLDSVRILASDADSCPDRVVARLRGLKRGRSVELLLPGEPLCRTRAAQARRSLRTGEILLESDVAWIDGWVPPSAWHDGQGSVIGMYVRQGIPRDRWIRRADLRDPPLVQRGQRLRIVYSAPGLQLEGQGIARRDGWSGDLVPVRLTGAEHDCDGFVSASGEVRCGPDPGAIPGNATQAEGVKR